MKTSLNSMIEMSRQALQNAEMRALQLRGQLEGMTQVLQKMQSGEIEGELPSNLTQLLLHKIIWYLLPSVTPQNLLDRQKSFMIWVECWHVLKLPIGNLLKELDANPNFGKPGFLKELEGMVSTWVPNPDLPLTEIPVEDGKDPV